MALGRYTVRGVMGNGVELIYWRTQTVTAVAGWKTTLQCNARNYNPTRGQFQTQYPLDTNKIPKAKIELRANLPVSLDKLALGT